MSEVTATVSVAPSREEMVERAIAMIPKLAERAALVEDTRTIHPDTVKDLWDAQLWSILKPRRYGGLELDFGTVIDISEHIGRGCASTAWIYGNLISHDWMLPMWHAKAQETVWRDNPRALIASSLVTPAGRAKPVDGGFELSGRWPYCSGIDPSDWIMIGAMIDDEGPKRPLWLMVPRDQFEEIDTWQVMGLVGTGSRDVQCEAVYVADYMTLEPKETRGGPTPGTPHVPGLVYQLPVLGLFPHILVGPMVGIARGAYDDYVGEIRDRRSTANAAKLAEHTQIQMKVAEADALIKAARVLALDNIHEAERIVATGIQPDVITKVRWRRDGAYAAQNCVKAVQLLQSVIGAAGNFLSNPFQRRFRDIHAAGSQNQVIFDINGAKFCRVELGLDPVNKAI